MELTSTQKVAHQLVLIQPSTATWQNSSVLQSDLRIFDLSTNIMNVVTMALPNGR